MQDEFYVELGDKTCVLDSFKSETCMYKKDGHHVRKMKYIEHNQYIYVYIIC